MNLKKISICLFVVFSSAQSYASKIEFQQFLNSITVKSDPGIVVKVIKDSTEILSGESGVEDVQSQKTLSEQSRFQLASSSKQFTGYAIAILEQQGLLKTSDRLSKFFPSIPKHFKNIEVQQLIHHTSGLPEYFSESDLCFRKKATTKADVVRFLNLGSPLHFVPGTQFEYNNTGYVLLAVIIEKISGLSYGRFLRENIFKPLSMNLTVTAEDVYSKKINFVKSYQTVDGKQVAYPATSCDRIEGDGGVFSTAADLKLWFKHLSQGLLEDHSPLMAKLFSPSLLTNGESVNYGYGWFLMKDNQDRPIYHHGGGWLGYHHSIVFSPTEKMWLVVLSNHLDYGPPARDSIADQFMEIARTIQP